MRTKQYAVFVLLLFVRAGSAQEPVKVEPAEVAEHRIGPPSLIHFKTDPASPRDQQITLEVIVDVTGRVELAQATSGPEEFFSEAQNLETERRFKPFEKDGVPVRVSFSDYVLIVPPEQWKETNVAFPDIKDWTTLRMQLKRTACYGMCPDYSVTVQGDGTVEFEGSGNVLITGHHRSKISKQAVQDLFAAFQRANYFSLKDEYVAFITDNPTYTTSIEFDKIKKSVRDYVGLSVGMPAVVRVLENTIDQIAETEKWIKGNEQTGAALVAEGWNFRADTEENRTLFASVVAHDSKDLAELFLSRGAPVFSMTQRGENPFVSAAENGNFELIRKMMNQQTKPPAALTTCALGAAAHSGRLELVQFLLEQGGQPNGPLCGIYKETTVLMNATQSGKAEIVETILKYHPAIDAKNSTGYTALILALDENPAQTETQKIVDLLLAAGANVNSRDEEGQTPIFFACMNQHPDIIPTLVAAGADVNARDNNGGTALMSCFDNASLRAMVDAGADLTIQNRAGRTAAEEARQMGMAEKAELLENLMKEQAAKKEK